MKRTLKSFFVSTLMVLICLTLVACVKDTQTNELDSTLPFSDKYPENVNTEYKISREMNAIEMYEAGVKNFLEADFVASHQLGNITTKSLLGTMNQKLDCFKIKQDNKYYLDSTSYTVSGGPEIRMCDQSIYENGKYRVRSANSDDIKINKDKDGIIVSKWPATSHFSSLSEGLDSFPDDLTRMNMYIVNADTAKSFTRRPVYDAKNRTYKFSITLDISTATEDYIPTMVYKTNKGSSLMNISGKDITFSRLRLTVVMWENGLIKSVANDEAYDIKVFGGSSTTLLATTYFTYDRAERNINNYLTF